MGASIKRKDKKLLKKAKSKDVETFYPDEKNPFENGNEKSNKKTKKIKNGKKNNEDKLIKPPNRLRKKIKKVKKNKKSANTSTDKSRGYDEFKEIPDSIKTPVSRLDKDVIESSNVGNKNKSNSNNSMSSRGNFSNDESNGHQLSVTQPAVNNIHERKDENLRPNRSGSISKKKRKKLRIKNVAKILKNDHEKNSKKKIEEQPQVNVVIRRPTIRRTPEESTEKHLSVQALQKEVDDVASTARNSAYIALEARHDKLKELQERSNHLEEATFQFAKTTREVHVTQKSRTTCCGIGSNSRFLRYICACTRPVKRKGKYKGNGSRGRGNAEDDEEEAYKLVNPPQKPINNQVEHLKTSSNLSLAFAQMPNKSKNSSLTGSRISLNSSNDSKFGRVKDSIRNSMPHLENIPKVPTLFKADKRSRKYSSTSALDEKPLSKKQLKKKQEEQEKSIQEIRSQFVDDEMRKRAESLLRMDYQ